nr:MAG TPA: hypothetical protein [Caudoviricetes sp.]
MTTFSDWNDMVNDWTQWVGVFNSFIHLLTTYSTIVLCLKQSLFVLIKCGTVRTGLIKPHGILLTYPLI